METGRSQSAHTVQLAEAAIITPIASISHTHPVKAGICHAISEMTVKATNMAHRNSPAKDRLPNNHQAHAGAAACVTLSAPEVRATGWAVQRL